MAVAERCWREGFLVAQVNKKLTRAWAEGSSVGKGTQYLHRGPCSKPVSPCLAGGAGEREKVPANPEALLLMANSQRDMEDWVQAIRRVIWAPFGGGTARSPHAHPLEPLPPGNHALCLPLGLQDSARSGLPGCTHASSGM